MLWNHQRAEEERRDSRGKKKKGISGAAAEHVAQSNQYFLVTAGIGLRNKPSLINHMENHSHTLTNTSLWDGTFVWHRGKRVSLYLLMWAYMFGDTDNWAFVWDLPPPSCCLLLLHHLPLLPSSPPWCCYCCDIFLSSIPEVIWLVKLHLFPRLPPPECSSSISCLGGCNHSRLVLGPRPWRPTPPPIHRHRDDPTSITMETTFAQRCATPTLKSQQSHWCLYTSV